MSNKKIKFLLIGINGKHSEHIQAFIKNKQIEIVGICNPDKKECELLQKHFNKTPFYSDYKKAIDTDSPDAIFICMPHNFHGKAVAYAMKKNIHIFKEKPFAINLKEANMIMRKKLTSKSKLMIVSQRRFHKSYIEAKKHIPSIGRVHLVTAEYSFNRTPSGWRKNKKESGGGVLIDSGYHFIDLVNFYFGLPDKVFCRLNLLESNDMHDTEDNGTVIFSYKDNMIATIIFSRIAQSKENITIYGENGQIDVGKSYLFVRDRNKKIVKKVLIKNDWFNAFNKQLKHFTQNVSLNEEFHPSFTEGFQNTNIISKCYKSNETFRNEKILPYLN